MGRRFVVLDRDGTLIVERGYLSDPDGVELLPATAEGLRRLRALDLGLVVITNQSGLARGYFDEPRLSRIHERMSALLAAEGLALDGLYVCPHLPDAGCNCRKPHPGLLQQAACALGFFARDSFVIGDKACDIELGQGVGAATILVRTGYGAQEEATGTTRADYVVDDLVGAADLIARILAGERERL